MNQKQEGLQPLFLDDHIFDVKFSPCGHFLATAQIDGSIRIFKYDTQSGECVQQGHYQKHTESCRCVCFSQDGQSEIQGELQSYFLDLRINPQPWWLMENAQDLKMLTGERNLYSRHPIFCIRMITDSLLATGDDQGEIRVWDLKAKKQRPIMKFSEHEETCTGLAYNQDQNMLVSSSTDGTLGVYDFRKPNELYAMSDNFEEDLLGVELMKSGKKVVANSSEGVLNLFSWDWFGDCDDRIAGHSCSIDAIAKVDEDTLLTGAEDGLIRSVGLFPNKILRIVGDHYQQAPSEDHYPIGKIGISFEKDVAASVSHDGYVRFYDIAIDRDRPKGAQYLEEQQKEQEEVEEQQQLQNSLKDLQKKKKAGFFSEL